VAVTVFFGDFDFTFLLLMKAAKDPLEDFPGDRGGDNDKGIVKPLTTPKALA